MTTTCRAVCLNRISMLPYDYRFTCNADQWDHAERICQVLEGCQVAAQATEKIGTTKAM